MSNTFKTSIFKTHETEVYDILPVLGKMANGYPEVDNDIDYSRYIICYSVDYRYHEDWPEVNHLEVAVKNGLLGELYFFFKKFIRDTLDINCSITFDVGGCLLSIDIEILL